MIRLKRRRLLEATAELTSVMDVVFILLIFFLLTAVQAPLGISVQLPQADSATQHEKDIIQLSLKPNQEIYLQDKLVSLEELGDSLQNLKPPRPILLAGDQSVSYGFLIKILDRLSQIPDYPLILATDPEPMASPGSKQP